MPPVTLTKQELRIAIFITEGYSTKEIAGMLMLSFRTIQNHRSSIYYKLKVGDCMDVAKWVIEQKLINPEEWCKRRRTVEHNSDVYLYKEPKPKLKLESKPPSDTQPSAPSRPQT